MSFIQRISRLPAIASRMTGASVSGGTPSVASIAAQNMVGQQLATTAAPQGSQPAPAQPQTFTATLPNQNYEFSAPSNYNYGATYGQTTRNPYADRVMAGPESIAMNNNADVRNRNANVANANLGNNAFSGMQGQWNVSGDPMLSRLAGQVNANLDSSGLQKSYMDRSADSSAKATAASVNAAREAGMSPAEVMQARNMGMQNQQDAMRNASMDAENIAASRRGEASNLLGFMRSPVEQLGQAQIQSGENLANRVYGSGENLASRQFSAGQNLADASNESSQNTLDRTYNIGEGAAGRDMTGGENYATRAIAGMRTGMEFGPATAQGYGSSMLMGGAGMNTQDPNFRAALGNEMAGRSATDSSLGGLYGSMGNYYDRLTNGLSASAQATTQAATQAPSGAGALFSGGFGALPIPRMPDLSAQRGPMISGPYGARAGMNGF